MIGVDVDRMFDGMAKAVKRAPVAKRRIAGHDAVFFAQLTRFKPGDAIIGIDGFVVPDRGSVQHRVVVNFGNRRAIFFAGITNGHSKPQLNIRTL